MATTRLSTAANLEAMGTVDKCYELYDGVLRETERMGQRHGEIQFELGGPLHAHVRVNRLGRVYSSDTHFILFRDPDTVVMPDVAFVREDRRARSVTVYVPGQAPRTLREGDTLDGGDVIPGFRLPVAGIFA